ELEYLQLGWRPPEGGWSIGQVFEHLILTDTPYLETMQRALVGAKHGGGAWQPSFMGGMIIRAVDPGTARKSKAFKKHQPGPQPRANVIDEYLARREQLTDLIGAARGVDLRAVRMRSPIIGLVRLNLGDAIQIMVSHTRRHLQQIERLRQHPDFPSTTSPSPS
ncbi:MAG TPA: DinB family protein, partial [Longimicrobiales bacterium]